MFLCVPFSTPQVQETSDLLHSEPLYRPFAILHHPSNRLATWLQVGPGLSYRGLKTETPPAAGSDLGIENTNIKTANGVTLDEQQKTLVGSVLDVRYLSPALLRAFANDRYSYLPAGHR